MRHFGRSVKRVALLGLVVALGVSASGCDTSPPAATVGGVDISQATLNGDLNQLLSNSYALCATEVFQGGTISPSGVGTTSDGSPNAVTSQVASAQLDTLVVDELYSQALSRRGLSVSAQDVQSAKVDYQNELEAATNQNGSPCQLSGSQLYSRLPADFVEREATFLANQEKLAESVGHLDLSEEALQRYYQSHLSTFNEPCLNLIVATSKAAAQSIYDAISAGSTFPDQSQGSGVSSSSPPEGEVACVAPSAVSDTFGTAIAAQIDSIAVGKIAEPIEWTDASTGTTSWLVVQMRQRQELTFEQVESTIRAGLLSQSGALQKAQDAVISKAKSTHVTVDPQYGTWTASKGLVAPVPPPSKFVLNPSANQPSGTSSSGLTAPGGRPSA